MRIASRRMQDESDTQEALLPQSNVPSGISSSPFASAMIAVLVFVKVVWCCAFADAVLLQRIPSVLMEVGYKIR